MPTSCGLVFWAKSVLLVVMQSVEGHGCSSVSCASSLQEQRIQLASGRLPAMRGLPTRLCRALLLLLQLLAVHDPDPSLRCTVLLAVLFEVPETRHAEGVHATNEIHSELQTTQACIWQHLVGTGPKQTGQAALGQQMVEKRAEARRAQLFHTEHTASCRHALQQWSQRTGTGPHAQAHTRRCGVTTTP